jgi:molecular chaperone HtpG
MTKVVSLSEVKKESGTQRAQVDFDGLMGVLANNLYSTPFVAVRELVQNAHDSCTRRSLEDGPFEPRIEVETDKAKSRLLIRDNGAGLTRDEIHRFLATVGAGYTRVLREQSQSRELIGAFGLGFLSAYVIAELVEVFTTSYQNPGQTWRFQSRNAQRYSIDEVEPAEVGTTVVLHLKKEFDSMADAALLNHLLRRYCCLLPLPIYAPEQINEDPPPWREEGLSSLRRRKVQMEFAQRFQPHFDPMGTMQVTAESGPAKGLLWIQDGATYGTSDNRHVVLFVRGMLISEEIRKLLPRWAGFVGGVIECDELVPTASRETIQEDEVFFQVQAQLEEALIQGLVTLSKEEPVAWRRILMQHNEALLGAALCDQRLLELLAPALSVPTTEGDLTLPQVVERSEHKLYVTTSEKSGFEEVLFRALSVPIIKGYRYAAFPFARRFSELRHVPLIELGTSEGEGAVFTRVAVSDEERAQLEKHLGGDDLKVVAARFAPSSLPVVRVTNEEVALKRRLEDNEVDKRISSGLLSLARQFTKTIQEDPLVNVYANLDCPLLQRLLEMEETPRRELGWNMVQSLSLLMSPPDSENSSEALSTALQTWSETVIALIEPNN